MPRGDKTGPMGMGPLTGRGAGYCAGGRNLEYAGPGFAAGFGRGTGRGRRNRRFPTGRQGWMQDMMSGRWWRGRTDAAMDKADLEQYAQHLRSELEAVEKQMEEKDQDNR